MLQMKAVTKVYRTELVETHALRELSLEVTDGEFVAVTGPSGSGKTTFLNIAGLLEELSGGEYRLDGVDVRELDDRARSKLRNEKIGFVFQSFNLIPDLNLFDNVDVPLRYRGFPRKERKQRIEHALERVGLASRIKHYPAELSGGQQQRVFIARALAQEAELMLMDEPLNGLDVKSQEDIFIILDELRQRQVTIMVATHDLNLAAERFDRLMLLNQRVIGFGQANEVFTADLLNRAYSGRIRLLETANGVMVIGDSCCDGGEEHSHA